MKKILIAAGAILMMAACVKEEVTVNESPENGTIQTVEVNVEPFVSTDTKTSVSVSGNTATYSWSVGDEIGIYPVSSTLGTDQTSQQIKFKINGSGGATTATFSGTGWGLVTSGTYKYFAYYPYSSAVTYTQASFSLPSSYNQTANGSTDHLTGYDVLYSSQIQPSSADQAQFTFKHLTALVDFKITVPDSVKTRAFTRMTVTAPSALFTTAGTYNPSSATASILAPEITSTATTDKLSLTMNEMTGFIPDADSTFHLYFYVAPASLKNQTLTVELWDSKNKGYTASGTLTKDLVSGNFYILPFSVKPKSAVAVDLSANGTANCYIVSENHKYKFRANVKGNGVVPSGMTESSSLSMTGCIAEVIWETVNTPTAPAIGTIVSNAEIEGNYILFDATGVSGNALIALKDANDNIVWSWHIWSTSADLEELAHTYPNEAGEMMDRNLGALSATPGDPLTIGFHYQWGRFNPYPGFCDFSWGTMATTNSEVWVEEETTATKGTIAYSTSHPTSFIYASAYNYLSGTTTLSGNWLWTANDYSTESSMPLFWSATKTMYDPCPVGWKVPVGGGTGVWSTAGFSTDTFLINSYGRTFTSTSPSFTDYYSGAGYRGASGNAQDATLHNLGTGGFYWSSSVATGKIHASTSFYNKNDVTPNALQVRAFGGSIRPCKDL